MANKIVRTSTKAKGGITFSEKKQMDAIAKKWTDIAFQTGAVDKDRLIEAIKRLYAVSGLKGAKPAAIKSALTKESV